MKELRAYMEEVFTDYNDINEDTRMLIFSVITTVRGRNLNCVS